MLCEVAIAMLASRWRHEHCGDIVPYGAVRGGQRGHPDEEGHNGSPPEIPPRPLIDKIRMSHKDLLKKHADNNPRGLTPRTCAMRPVGRG